MQAGGHSGQQHPRRPSTRRSAAPHTTHRPPRTHPQYLDRNLVFTCVHTPSLTHSIKRTLKSACILSLSFTNQRQHRDGSDGQPPAHWAHTLLCLLQKRKGSKGIGRATGAGQVRVSVASVAVLAPVGVACLVCVLQAECRARHQHPHNEYQRQENVLNHSVFVHRRLVAAHLHSYTHHLGTLNTTYAKYLTKKNTNIRRPGGHAPANDIRIYI